MGFNWSGLLVRAPDEAAFELIKKHDSRARMLPGGFALVGWDGGHEWGEAGTTVPWSSKLGEVWYLEAASVSGVFGYEHGKDGQILRSLGFYPDEGWVVVEGEPEPWEEDVWDGSPPVEGDAEPDADATLILLIAEKLGTELSR